MYHKFWTTKHTPQIWGKKKVLHTASHSWLRKNVQTSTQKTVDKSLELHQPKELSQSKYAPSHLFLGDYSWKKFI